MGIGSIFNSVIVRQNRGTVSVSRCGLGVVTDKMVVVLVVGFRPIKTPPPFPKPATQVKVDGRVGFPAKMERNERVILNFIFVGRLKRTRNS